VLLGPRQAENCRQSNRCEAVFRRAAIRHIWRAMFASVLSMSIAFGAPGSEIIESRKSPVLPIVSERDAHAAGSLLSSKNAAGDTRVSENCYEALTKFHTRKQFQKLIEEIQLPEAEGFFSLALAKAENRRIIAMDISLTKFELLRSALVQALTPRKSAC